MKYFLILLVLIGFVGFGSPPGYAELDESLLEPFENNDLVVIGKIIKVNTIISENKTEYNIQVEEYLKNQKSFDMITVMLDGVRSPDFPNYPMNFPDSNPLDYYNKPYFEEGNQVLAYLKQEDGTYKLSPYSFTVKKNEFAGPPTVIIPTGPQGHYFSQGDEIIISGVIKKAYLYELGKLGKNSDLHLVILNEKDKQVVSKKLKPNLDGSYKFSFQNKNDLHTPGEYSWEIQFGHSGMGGVFVLEPDFDLWKPLKQIKNGVALIDVTCNDGKYLSYKADRMRAACVSEETQNALWLRGWATMRLMMPGDNISHALCNNYDGKWHPKYEGCRGENITDLQCSLMGGEFVNNLKICYDGICPVDKTYTLCVTNPDLISGEKEDED